MFIYYMGYNMYPVRSSPENTYELAAGAIISNSRHGWGAE